jgi:glutathione reductase (NADPH)
MSDNACDSNHSYTHNFNHNYDLFVIGAGSGGVRASRVAAGLGARTAVVEERYLGGTCVNVGCVPKKLLVYASHFREDLEQAEAGYGWRLGSRSFDWAAFLANKDAEIERLNGVYERLLAGAGVDIKYGSAVVIDPHTVDVGPERYTAKFILIASGSWPQVPDVPGVELGITSNEAFHLQELPRRVIVVGGGYIAVEFAGIFAGLGAEVVQLYRGPLFLRGFDDDVRRHLAEAIRRRGIDLRFDVNVDAIRATGRGLGATLTDGAEIEADQILLATGRRPKTRGLGLAEAGVALDSNGAVVVDDLSRASVPSIYAVGDVTDRVTLTPVALHEGECVARTLFGPEPVAPVYQDVPSAVFSQPPVGTVGLTEAEARARYGDIDVYRSVFRSLKGTLTGTDETTLMKLVVERASDRVVGLHMVGPEAGEIVQGFAVAIQCRATKAQFDATLGIHPTLAEELVTMREPVGDSG